MVSPSSPQFTELMPPMDDFSNSLLDYLNIHRPETVVVAVTGYISLEFASASLERGAHDYITKPFDYDLFRTTIERALEHARQQHLPRNDETAPCSTPNL
jgi:two-component system, NtrC family, nitrogen regulation response regulator GlnG